MPTYTVTQPTTSFNAIQFTGSNYSDVQTFVDSVNSTFGNPLYTLLEKVDGTLWLYFKGDGSLAQVPTNSWLLHVAPTGSGTVMFLASYNSAPIMILDNTTFTSIFTV